MSHECGCGLNIWSCDGYGEVVDPGLACNKRTKMQEEPIIYINQN